MGQRLWEVFLVREREHTKRQMQYLQQEKLLERIRERFWRYLFARTLGPPEKIPNAKDGTSRKIFFLRDKRPVTDACVSFPPRYGGSRPATLLVGVI